MGSVFFERQSGNNCTIHSVNNAMGRVVITEQEVKDHVRRRIEYVAACMGLSPDDDIFRRAKGKMVTKRSEFTADTVWRAAVAKRRIRRPRRFVAFKGSVIPSMNRMRLVFLGIGKDGTQHAVGARFGWLFDSAYYDGPVPLTNRTLRGIFSRIFAVFSLTEFTSPL